VFPSTDAKAPNEPAMLRLRKRDGMTYLVATAIIEMGSGAGPQRIVHVAYDATHEEALLRHYRDETLAVILLGTLACVLLGALVARKGLQPLAEITEATRSITATHLDQRIGQRPWPRELVALANAFDAMLARLELSVVRLSQFSADLAHELRTPLNNLIGEAEVWLSRSRSEAEYRALIESSLEECTRLSRLIEELLFLARVENDKLRIEKVEIEARDVAEDVKSLYEALAEERGIELCCEGRASVKASPTLLRRALINLVSNGVKYATAGGRVVIAAQRVTGGAEIAVSDDGDGIPEEHLPRIFDRFYRVDSARSRDPDGSGLGLAIVKSIVDLHGGRIEVSSTVHQGTTATLRLTDA
jgi:two-component system heavy metal sensor histidine kinase CusS